MFKTWFSLVQKAPQPVPKSAERHSATLLCKSISNRTPSRRGAWGTRTMPTANSGAPCLHFLRVPSCRLPNLPTTAVFRVFPLLLFCVLRLWYCVFSISNLSHFYVCPLSLFSASLLILVVRLVLVPNFPHVPCQGFPLVPARPHFFFPRVTSASLLLAY